MINIRNISLFGGLFAIVVIALGAWTRLVDAVWVVQIGPDATDL